MTAPTTGNDLLLRSFARSLRARNRSPRTVQAYLESAQLLAAYTGRDLDSLTRADVEDFLGDQLSRHRATTAAGRYRNLQQFYRWAVEEQLVEVSPMAGLRPPTVPETPVPVLDEAAIGRLLGTMNGREFEDRRDTAIVRLFLDTGMRLSEVAGLGLTDIDLDTDVALVMGKGRRPRACPFGDKTGQAVERYLRERRKHSLAHRPELWVGARGVLTGNGITQMLRRRAKQADIAHLHPHMFETDNLTIAVVCLDERRRAVLMDWTMRELRARELDKYGQLFLFTATSPVYATPSRFFFGNVWRQADAEKPVSLIEPPVARADEKGVVFQTERTPKYR